MRFICPKCKKPIDHVVITSMCTQKGFLDGNNVISRESVDDIFNVQSRECPRCFKDISKFIKDPIA